MGIFRRVERVHRRKRFFLSDSTAATQNLIGEYIDPTSVMYGGYVYSGVWRIDDVQSGANIDEDAWSVDVATSSRAGRGIVLFVVSVDLANETSALFATDSGAFTLAHTSDHVRAYVTDAVAAGGETVHFHISASTRIAWFIVALSGIETAALMAESFEYDDTTDLDLFGPYNTNGAGLAVTWTASIHSPTIDAVSGAYEIAEERPVTLGYQRSNVTLRPITAAGSYSVNIGASWSYAGPGTPIFYTAALILRGTQGSLTGAYIAPTSTVYAGVVTGGVQLLNGAYIAPTSTVYAGSLIPILTGAYISPTSVVYAGQLNQYMEGAYIEPTSFLLAGSIFTEGETQYLYGSFIGMGQPNMLGGAYIEPTSVCYAGEIISNIVLTGAYISPTSVVYAGVLTGHAYTGTGAVYAGVIFNVP